MEPPPGGPPDADAAAACRDPARLVCPASRLQGRRRVPLRRGDLRGRLAQPGRRHRRPGEAGHPLAHDARAGRELAAHRITVRPREGWRRTGSTGSSCCRASPTCAATGAKSGTVVTFTTGAPLPADHARGHRRGLDLRPARARGVGGSVAAARQPAVPRRWPIRAGHFSLGPLPAGEYVVERRAGPEPQPCGWTLARPSTPSGSPVGAPRRRALGLRPRHDPAANPRDHVGRQRVAPRSS